MKINFVATVGRSGNDLSNLGRRVREVGTNITEMELHRSVNRIALVTHDALVKSSWAPVIMVPMEARFPTPVRLGSVRPDTRIPDFLSPSDKLTLAPVAARAPPIGSAIRPQRLALFAIVRSALFFRGNLALRFSDFQLAKSSHSESFRREPFRASCTFAVSRVDCSTKSFSYLLFGAKVPSA